MSQITSATARITCAFCKGKGKDPFNLLSELAVCQVCGGTGKVEVVEPVIRCAFCKGSGVYHNTRITCTVCNGKGMVTAPKGPTEWCSKCEGTGTTIDSAMPCLTCEGKGVISKQRKNKLILSEDFNREKLADEAGKRISRRQEVYQND